MDGAAPITRTAQTISRDTAGANPALTQQFTDAKRADIQQGFDAAQTLNTETGTFLANRAADETALRDKAKAAQFNQQADRIRDTYGAGSPARLVALISLVKTHPSGGVFVWVE